MRPIEEQNRTETEKHGRRGVSEHGRDIAGDAHEQGAEDEAARRVEA